MIPSFAMTAFAYSLTKSIDYSIFGVLREMLFLPLKLDEKYRAKAVIDVFAHRTSKALASFLLIGSGMVCWRPGFCFGQLSIICSFSWLVCCCRFSFQKSELQEVSATD